MMCGGVGGGGGDGNAAVVVHMFVIAYVNLYSRLFILDDIL